MPLRVYAPSVLAQPRRYHINSPLHRIAKCPSCEGKKSIRAIVCRVCQCNNKRSPIIDDVFIIDGDRCRRIPLTQGQYAIVDECDYDSLIGTRWYAQWAPNTNSFYAKAIGIRRGSGYLRVAMHRIVADIQSDRLGDHVNGNTLDNRKRNIRPSNNSENTSNSKLSTKNTSGFRGVSWNRWRRGWHSYIRIDKKLIHLGFYATAEEAAQVRDTAAIRYHGQFATLNFLTLDTCDELPGSRLRP